MLVEPLKCYYDKIWLLHVKECHHPEHRNYLYKSSQYIYLIGGINICSKVHQSRSCFVVALPCCNMQRHSLPLYIKHYILNSYYLITTPNKLRTFDFVDKAVNHYTHTHMHKNSAVLTILAALTSAPKHCRAFTI